MLWFAFSMTNRMRLCWRAFEYLVQPVFRSDSKYDICSVCSLWLLTFRRVIAVKWKCNKVNNMLWFSHVITFNDYSAITALGDFNLFILWWCTKTKHRALSMIGPSTWNGDCTSSPGFFSPHSIGYLTLLSSAWPGSGAPASRDLVGALYKIWLIDWL